MKKILAVLLAGAMVLGMGLTAFADWDSTNAAHVFMADPFVIDEDLNDEDADYWYATLDIDDVYMWNTVADVQVDGTFGEEDSLEFDDVQPGLRNPSDSIRRLAYVPSASSWNDKTIVMAFNPNNEWAPGDNIDGSIQVLVNVVYDDVASPTATGIVETLVWTIDFDNVTIKKTSVDGDTAGKITRFADNKGLANGFAGDGFDDVEFGDEYAHIALPKMVPIDGNDIRFYLWAHMFAGTDYAPGVDDFLGQSAVRANRMSVRAQVAKGSDLIKAGPTIKYDNGRAYIDIDFLTEMTSVDEESFEFSVYLSIDGKRMDRNGEGVLVTGSLENIHIDVYGDDEDEYLDEQDVIVAREFNEEIELHLGAGVSVHTKLFKGKEYYGIAKRNGDERDDVVYAEYPDVDNVVRIYSVGLSSTGDVVEFNTDYDGYWVYDANFELLGMADEPIPFRNIYYLANRELDIDADVEPLEPDDNYVPVPDNGGDEAPSNINNIPGTGF